MVVASFLAATAQVLMKLSSQVSFLRSIEWFKYIILAGILLFIVIGITLWAYAGGLKVNIMYPLTSLGYVFGAFLAWKILGEKVTPLTMIGTVIIITGVFLIGIGATK